MPEREKPAKNGARDAWAFDLLNGRLTRRSPFARPAGEAANNALFPLSGESARALCATLDSLRLGPEPPPPTSASLSVAASGRTYCALASGSSKPNSSERCAARATWKKWCCVPPERRFVKLPAPNRNPSYDPVPGFTDSTVCPLSCRTDKRDLQLSAGSRAGRST